MWYSKGKLVQFLYSQKLSIDICKNVLYWGLFRARNITEIGYFFTLSPLNLSRFWQIWKYHLNERWGASSYKAQVVKRRIYVEVNQWLMYVTWPYFLRKKLSMFLNHLKKVPDFRSFRWQLNHLLRSIFGPIVYIFNRAQGVHVILTGSCFYHR